MRSKKRRLTPEAVIDMPVVRDAQISPDGARIAYVKGEMGREGTRFGKQRIWMVDADGRNDREFTTGPRADFHPRWSPDGTRIAFLSDRIEDGRMQLLVADPAGGEAEALTTLEGDIDPSRGKDCIQWSPDGRRIALLIRDSKSEERKRREKERDDAVEFERDPRYTRLWVLDLKTRAFRQVTRGRVQVWEFAWSPDGRNFALIASGSPEEWSWYESALARVSAAGGRLNVLWDPAPRQLALPRWSPDGRRIAFLSCVWSDRGVIGGGVFVMPAAGGRPVQLAPRHRGTVSWMEWKRDGRSLLAAGYEEGQAAIHSIELRSGRARRLWRAPVQILENHWSRFSISRDQKRLAVVRSAPHEARDVWRGDLSKTSIRWRKLTDSVPELRKFELGAQEIVSWKSRDGRRVQGVLILPVGYRRGKRVPMIVCPHGGPTSIVSNGFLGGNPQSQLLAARGYAVFLPNFRGSTGYGLEFAEANVGDLGGGDFEDVESGVDALIERGIANPKRLGYGGWSYGGYMTAWTVTQTRRYRAAVAGAAITNWQSFHGNSHLCTWDAIHNAASPYERGGIYDTNSPMNHVHKVRTPTLLLHGERDRDVTPEQSYQFYRALRDHGVKTTLVTYPRAGHNPDERKHMLDVRRRVIAWYEKYV